MTDRLDAYRSKRDFGSTPEPGPGEGTDAAEQPRFVVHEHHARRLHWDLRLEREGVLVSWAVPKGIPPDPKRNHLAVHTEDHPIEYIDFSGEIPAGNYGAGVMKIWDTGTYETHKFREDEVMVTFHGERLHGRYVLFRTRGDDWMIHRMDPPEDPEREPMPEHIPPMLATTGTLPRDEEGWAFEIKWDGVRAIAYAQGGTLRLESRNGRDITPRYPELRDLGRALGAREAIFDGEVVAFDGGRPSFQKLQGRMHLTSEHAVRRLAASDPVTYMIFDLLYLDGHSTMALSYEERRSLLDRLELEGPAWRTPSYHRGEGSALLEATKQHGIEGVVAKKLDCPYQPGVRASHWVKVKNVHTQDVVIGGWTPGEGGRSTSLGSLAVGVMEGDELVYCGKVGTGFTEQSLALVKRELDSLRIDSSPFSRRQPPKGTIFVEPRLVAHVEFREWTKSGTLRAPSFKGLRPDISPQECVREEG
jgi:bifunctional non-homologous end joining protein LigD